MFSVTRASGGTARNVIPDLKELNLNYRFTPGKSLEQAREDVLALVAGRTEVEFTDLSSSGLDARSKRAWTDVARLGALGVDAINLGPGETGQAHQAGESAGILAMASVYEVLAAFLRTAPRP